MFGAGIVKYLTLSETAIPTVYTVGTSPPARVSIQIFWAQSESTLFTTSINVIGFDVHD